MAAHVHDLSSSNATIHIFLWGSMLYKQWVGLRAAPNRCLSHCSIKSAEYGVCDVSCHLRALLNTASTLCRSSAESWPASAGNAYWNLATTRAINTWVSPQTLSHCLSSWFKRYKRWFNILIVYLTCACIDSVGVNNIPSSLASSTCSICIKGGGVM